MVLKTLHGQNSLRVRIKGNRMLTGIIQTLANILKLKIEDVVLVVVIIIAITVSELSEAIKRKIVQLLERSWKT